MRFLLLLLALSLFYTSHENERFDIKCEICRMFVNGLHIVWSSDISKDCVAELATTICIFLKMQNEHICKAVVCNFKDEFAYIIGKLILEPHQICGFFISNCGMPYNFLQSNWTLKLPDNKPPVVHIKQPKVTAVPTLRVLQLADIHYDVKYKVGSEALCKSPLCCRSNTNNGQKVKVPAGKWATIAKCDIPFKIVENLFKKLSKSDKFDLIFWTGDLPPHDDWDYTKKRTTSMLKLLTKLFLKYFPHTPVISAVGNHEGVPINSFPPHYIPQHYGNDWLYEMLAKQWTNWLPKNTTSCIKWRASYMVKPFPDLRLISINTQYGLNVNFWLYINQTDPDGTLGWLIKQLTEAEKAGDKVIIIGHIPNGIDGLDGWSANYYRIVNRFESTIRAQVSGHEHFDTFHMFYDGVNYKKRVTNMIYVSPSLTTYSDTGRYFQPAYRVYTIDGNHTKSTWTILDYETYLMDVCESNKQNKPIWKLEYNAKEAYKLHSLLPKDWNNLIKKMEKDRKLFEKFLEFYYRRTDLPKCGHACQMKYLCTLRSAITEKLADKLCPKLEKFKSMKPIPKYSSETPQMKKSLKRLSSKCPI